MAGAVTHPALFRDTLFPSMTVVGAVLIAAMPWGLSGSSTFVLPSCTVAVIFVLNAGERPLVPIWLVFASGLFSDFLTAGPLGYWAVMHLMTYSCARIVSPQTRHWQWFVLWTCFIVTMALIGAAGWGLASLYFLRPIDWQPMLTGGVGASLAFPFVLGLLSWFFKLGRRRDRAIFSEGL